MTFFSTLYRYKQSSTRGAFEDYLTELLAQWFRLAEGQGLTNSLLTGLFKLDPGQLPVGPISWDTQHFIGSGNGRASHRRPDLVGSGKGFFLIIENKVSAPFTFHLDEETGERTPQLDLYCEYLQHRASRGNNERGGVCLLTFATEPPAGWEGPVCFWSEVHRTLRQELATGRISADSALGFVTTEFITFLGDNGMGGIELSESDLVVLPAWRRMQAALAQLQALAVRETTRIHQRVLITGEPALLPCGQTKEARGDFRPPHFFGELLTLGGESFNQTALAAWAGVMTDSCDWITPISSDVPELSIGLAVWCEYASFEGPGESVLAAFHHAVNSRQEANWEWQQCHRSENGPVMIFSSRTPLTVAWSEAESLGLDEWAAKHFKAHLEAVCDALAHTLDGVVFVDRFQSWVAQR